jgi:hypothetical protein
MDCPLNLPNGVDLEVNSFGYSKVMVVFTSVGQLLKT